MKRTAIIGLGCDAHSDAGTAVRIVRELEERNTDPSVVFHTSPVGGLELLDLLEGSASALIVDVVRVPGPAFGEVAFFHQDEYFETNHLSCYHDLGFDKVVEFAGVTGIPVPDEVWIAAIGIEEDMIFGESLSPEIETKYNEISRSVGEFVRKLSRKTELSEKD